MRKQFIVYDERANAVEGTDNAAVLVCEDTLKQARRWDGRGYVWSYDVQGSELVNEAYEGPTLTLEREDAREKQGGRRP